MKKSLFSLICCIGLVHVSDSVAQCVIGGTDFTTSTSLFNPEMKNDTNEVNGWFNSKVGDLLADQCGKSCNYYGQPYDAEHKGMSTNVIASDASTSVSWDDYSGAASNVTGETKGFGGIVANPRVISPYLTEGSGSNMFVAYGNGANNNILTYTISGLKPGSTVTVSADVYNLLSPENMEVALIAMNSKAGKKDLVKEIKLPGNMTYVMQSMGTTLTPGSGQLNGNKPSITLCTGVQYGQAAGDKTSTGTTFNWGDNETLKLTTKASATGTVTLYFKTASAFAPIGIDNILITGQVAPEIRSQKKLPVCPANPVLLTLKSNYPDGTSYKWTTPDGSYTTKNCTFEPKEANKSYKVTCEVTLPGCSKETTNFDLTTKTCCSMVGEDGKEYPMALTNIFYDDFGRFLDANTYEYTDAKGTVYTEPTTGIYGAGDTKRASVTMQPGARFNAAIKPCTAKGTLNDSYAITNVNPYNPGVNGDASGDPQGCMLVFDLSGSECNGVPVKDMVVYEREVCGLCKGKEITFSAKFGAINNQPPVGEMAVILRQDNNKGKILYEESEILQGGNDWIEKGTTFEITEAGINCVVMQVVNKQASFATSQGDYAIDDIVFTVCTPPDVAVDAELTNGTDLLDLCTDEILTLKAEISETAKNFYGSNLGYLYQYTYDNPETTDASKINWVDLGPIQANGDFVIDGPANHEAFKPLVTDPALKGLNIYFRVVIGKSDYLEQERDEWASMDAQSPCRAISISSIPIVAALNCAACSDPDPVKFSAEGGNFRAKDKVVELCAGESVELGMTNSVHGLDKDSKDYYDYEVKWFKEDVKSSALASNKCSESDTKAPTITVDYADVEAAGEKGVKYIISLHDYFDPAMASTPCDITDTITVIGNPKPEDKLDNPDPFCEGTLESEPKKTIAGFDIEWYEDADTTASTEEPVIGTLTKADMPKSYYYVLTDSKTGCRGEANEYEIEVNKADENNVDNSKKIEYKKTDAKSGSLKTLDQQNGAVFKAALAKTGYTLMIGLVDGADEATAPSLSGATLGAASDKIPAPTVKDANSSDDEYAWHYTYLKSAEGCLSDTVLVGVVIKGAPSPTTEGAAYCVNSSEAKPMSAYAKPAAEDPDGTLIFYGTDKTTKMDATDLPDVSKPGKYTYWVSQESSTGGGESSQQPIEIEVYGVNDVELAQTSDKYCKGSEATALEDIASAKSSSDEYVKNSGWEFFEANEPELNKKTSGAETSMAVSTTTAGEYKYYARLKYEIANSTEVCYGKHAEYTVEVQSVADPKTGTITYLKDEGKNGFKKPTDQDKANNGGVLTNLVGDADCTDCSIVWYDENKQKISETDATPTYNASLNDNEEHTYYVKQVNALGCESDFKELTIIVSGVPTPTVTNISVCEKSPKLTGTLQAETNPTSSNAKEDFELVWYNSKSDGTIDDSKELDEIELSDKNQPAAADGSKEITYRYYVLQRLITDPGNKSAAVPVTVTVYANPKLKAIETAPKCKGESQKLSEMYDIQPVDCKASWYDANQGSMVELASDVVTESGLYEVKGTYVINKGTSDEETCASQNEDLKVVFHELEAEIEGSDRTCPGVSVDLKAVPTVGGGLKEGDLYYEWKNNLNSETGSNSAYKTGADGLDAADDKMTVTVEVSSDACKGSRAVKKTHVITVGDGPLVGKIAFSEAKNTSKKEEPVSSSNITFNSCGGDVSVELSGIVNKDGGKYTLSGSSSESGTFSSETSGTASLSLGEGKYTLEYVNECPTKFEFEIIDYSNSATSTNGKMTICENENWSAEILDIKGPKPTIKWIHGTDTIAGESGAKLSFSPAKPTDSGTYSYTLLSAGCKLDGKIALGAELKVKPYVVLNANSYKKHYEVINGESQTISLEFKVPADASEISSDVKWSDAGAGFSQTGKEVTIDPVKSDYDLHIVAENKDYCKAEEDIEIRVDAKLNITAELEREEICEGETTKLTIDTTGTGKVLHPEGLSLKVTETTSEGTNVIRLTPNRSTKMLEAQVSPRKDAKYSVEYTYTVGNQSEPRELSVTVHEQFQLAWEPVEPVCEGDVSSIFITKLYPSGTDLDWNDNPAEDGVSGTLSGATLTPKHTSADIARQTKQIKVIAKNGLCEDKPYLIDVPVDKPIEGEIQSQSKICQFEELTLDATSFQADTYEWIYEEKDSAFTGSTAKLVPEPDYATFTLSMTRGACRETADKQVEVTSAPSVDRVDSLSIRQVEIVMETNLGTEPFRYIIDGNEDDPEILNPIRDGLEYKEHVVKVVDEVGCSTEFKFVVNNPAIDIPFIVSPDDNGVNDKFVVKGLAEGYPDAKVTIFDRWGKKLAEYRAGDDTDWDGVYNGSKMPSTDYWYEIQIKEIKKTYTGHFTLIRQ